MTRTTATVLLIVDADSWSAGGVGTSMEVGFLHGRGVLGDDGRLDLELVDESVVPARNDTVVTWGSDGGAPYVSGRAGRPGHLGLQQRCARPPSAP